MLNNVNRLISRQLEKLKSERQLKDADVLKQCGFTRPTLAKIKNGGNITVETLASLANGLGVKVGFFFDEGEVELRVAERDYVERGKIEHRGTEYNGNVEGHTIEAELREQIAQLKSQLADKDRIIKLLEK